MMLTIVCIATLILLGIALLICLLPIFVELEGLDIEKYTEPISLGITIIVCLIGFYIKLKYPK